MTPASASGATQGVSAQFQATALKTAQKFQKQEGEAAVFLIKSGEKPLIIQHLRSQEIM